MGSTQRRAAVLGHPVGHSLSPVLHGAAYQALGLDWSYDAVDVEEPHLAAFLVGLDDAWAGLSLTMPLKVEAARLADFVEPQAKLVGIVNTLLPAGLGRYRQWVGANTDIHGIVAAFAEAGVQTGSRAAVIGGGATAASALAAFGAMGADRTDVVVRSKARAGRLMHAASKMGLRPRFIDLDADGALEAVTAADVVVSTVPSEAGGALAQRVSDGGREVTGHLLDVVYSPLTTPLLERWSQAGGRGIGGTRMLLHQAGEQVRLMTGHPAPLDAMESALAKVLNTS